MRIKSNIIVSAMLKSADSLGLHAAIMHKGDVDAGQIYIIINNNNGGFLLLGPQYGNSFNQQGDKIWCYPIGETVKTENQVNDYLKKMIQYDCDIYIIEIEDKTLKFRPNGEIADVEDAALKLQKKNANNIFKNH